MMYLVMIQIKLSSVLLCELNGTYWWDSRDWESTADEVEPSPGSSLVPTQAGGKICHQCPVPSFQTVMQGSQGSSSELLFGAMQHLTPLEERVQVLIQQVFLAQC